MHKQNFLIPALFFSLATASVQAHDAWVEPAGEDYQIVYGHADDLQDYEPAKVKELEVYSVEGESLPFGQMQHDDQVMIQPEDEVAMITLFFDNGFWTKTVDDESVNESKSNFEEYLEAFHSLKYGKSLFTWSEAAMQPKGLELEIVPLNNPFTLDNGDMLQVLYQGEPLADAVVGYGGDRNKDESSKVNTDAQGKAEIEMRTGELLTAAHRVPLPDSPDADARTLSANLFIAGQ